MWTVTNGEELDGHSVHDMELQINDPEDLHLME